VPGKRRRRSTPAGIGWPRGRARRGARRGAGEPRHDGAGKAALDSARRDSACAASRCRPSRPRAALERAPRAASTQITDLSQRHQETEAGLAELDEAPAAFLEKRRPCCTPGAGRAARREAADSSPPPKPPGRGDRARRGDRPAGDGARNQGAREERLSAPPSGRRRSSPGCADELETELAELPKLAASLARLCRTARRRGALAALKQERERLGGVNLLADEELTR